MASFVSDTVLRAGDTVKIKPNKNPCPHGTYIWVKNEWVDEQEMLWESCNLSSNTNQQISMGPAKLSRLKSILQT